MAADPRGRKADLWGLSLYDASMIRVLIMVALTATPAFAGLHLSLETWNELPAKWKGYLPDQRRLRSLAMPTLDGSRSASLMTSTYADALLKLEGKKDLTADEAADLGALHVRLGSPAKALGILRKAHAAHPEHFGIAANLGTAWQLAGDLEQAVIALEDAVKLAPAKWKPFEEAHLKLVQLRLKEKNKDYDNVDALFATPLPKDALAITQTLALWLPNDGRLLWQLGEIAHANGDTRIAANILDGCVSDFGMKSNTLRKQRQQYRAEADALEAKNEHAKESTVAFKSARPLQRLLDESKLPKIDADKVNVLPWAALVETTIARPFKVDTLKYVKDLDGKRVTLIGYMRPLEAGKAGDVSAFLLTEYAIGCWFCDVPDATGIVYVELKESTEPSRNALRVEGVLEVNTTDPEAYLFRIKDAKVVVAD
ncbi:hypothetical protein BH11PLA2_BH11PLA2_45220 [soil metagenome]